ncbi:MAG: transmembrane sensor [Roseivirga sp.]
MSEELENKEIIARWLSGELSDKERAALDKREDLGDLKAVLDDVSTWSLPPVDTAESLKKIKAQTAATKPENKVISMRPLFRVAAAIALLATVWFVYDYTSANGTIDLKTGLAETLSHDLPNGSVITLGAVSSASYDKGNWEDDRLIDLVGQAYFAVESGAKFTVNTAYGDVTVLGTQFDVQTVNGALKVNCFEGSVAVSSENGREVLKPGEGVIFEKGTFERVNFASTSPAWTGGSSVYQATALEDVVNDLKRYYQLSLSLPADRVNQAFTGSFPHDDLAQALRSVFSPLEIQYTLSADGTVVFN